MMQAYTRAARWIMRRQYYTYILASDSRVLYVGVTNSLLRRVHQHKSESCISFTARYHVVRLVYFQAYADVRTAITREKQIKRWTRRRKYRLIERHNPDWRDLSLDWLRDDAPCER